MPVFHVTTPLGDITGKPKHGDDWFTPNFSTPELKALFDGAIGLYGKTVYSDSLTVPDIICVLRGEGVNSTIIAGEHLIVSKMKYPKGAIK